jgi:hypothetical protein
MTTRAALLALTAFLAACSTDQPAKVTARIDTLPGGIVRTISDAPLGWSDTASAWKLALLHEIQPPEGDPGELFDPGNLAMNERGEIFVKDQKPSVIKVFDAEGNYVRSIGREGDGPGEFRVAFLAVRGDTLIAQDPQNSRVSTFNTQTGQVLSTWRSTCCYWYPIALDGQGRVVFFAMGQDSTRPNSQAIVRGRLDGTGLDTAWVTQRPPDEGKVWTVTQGKEMQFMMSVPYQPEDIHAADSRGSLISGWNGEYMLRTTSDGRDTVSLFGRAWTAEPVTGAERAAIVEKRIKDQQGEGGVPEVVLRDAFKPDYIPDIKPAFTSIETDPAGNRWIRLESGDTTHVHYDVFDPAGRWLGPIAIPASQWSGPYQRPAWGNDRVAVIGEGEDGRPVVRVFSIVKK